MVARTCQGRLPAPPWMRRLAQVSDSQSRSSAVINAISVPGGQRTLSRITASNESSVNAGAITNSGEATLGPAAVAYARNCRARRSVSAYGCSQLLQSHSRTRCGSSSAARPSAWLLPSNVSRLSPSPTWNRWAVACSKPRSTSLSLVMTPAARRTS